MLLTKTKNNKIANFCSQDNKKPSIIIPFTASLFGVFVALSEEVAHVSSVSLRYHSMYKSMYKVAQLAQRKWAWHFTGNEIIQS